MPAISTNRRAGIYARGCAPSSRIEPVIKSTTRAQTYVAGLCDAYTKEGWAFMPAIAIYQAHMIRTHQNMFYMKHAHALQGSKKICSGALCDRDCARVVMCR